MDYRPVREMTIEELREELTSRGVGYRPGMHLREVPHHGTFYQEFLEEVGEEGDEEQVVDKYVRRLLARGGFKKEEARKRLLRKLLEARGEGRL